MVAGGIGTSVLEFYKCTEEASIAEDIAQQYVCPVNAISYFFRSNAPVVLIFIRVITLILQDLKGLEIEYVPYLRSDRHC